MSVSNGQLANQTTFNNAFVSRLVNTSTAGKFDLLNIDAASGDDIINAQREFNSLAFFIGKATGTVFNFVPPWAENYVGTVNDDLMDRIEALVALFDGTTGHTHDGTDGDGAPISALDLDDINYYVAELQVTATISSASGSTFDASAAFSGKTPGGGTSTAGVITTAPNNRCEIRTASTGLEVNDSQGQKVYARLTESAGTWTLSFYTNESGVETAHTLSSQNIIVYFREVFTLASRPTIPADIGAIGSLDFTADVVDASATQRGVVSTGAQSFAGDKSFTDNLYRSTLGGVTAFAGGGQASATVLTKDNNVVTTVATTGDSVKLEAAVVGAKIRVFNDGANELDLFPASGDTILPMAMDAAYPLEADANIQLECVTTGEWRVFAASGGGGGGSGATGSTPQLLDNVSFTATVAANAITFTLKAGDGSTLSAINAATVAFHDQSETAGAYELITLDTEIDFTVSSGSTLGQISGRPEYTYVYLINQSGTVSLAASTSPYHDENRQVGGVTEGGAGAADSRTSLYTDSGGAGMCRLLGWVLTTQTVAGTWAASPTAISVIDPKLKYTSDPQLIQNFAINVEATGSDLVISARSENAGGLSIDSPGRIAFRSSTLGDGRYVVRTTTSVSNFTVSSGSTLGQISAQPETTYVYALDNAGSIEFAVSTSRIWDEAAIHNTTAEGGAGAADSRVLLYSATARTGVAIRLVGIFQSTQATAGTWATAPSLVAPAVPKHPIFTDEVIYNQASGYGSGRPRVRYLANQVKSVGTAITGASTSTNGTSFAINRAGWYVIDRQDSGTGTYFIAILVNPGNFTQSADSFGETNAPPYSNTNIGMIGSTAAYTNLSTVRYFWPGDVIYPYDLNGGNPDGSGAVNQSMRVALLHD